MNFNFTQIPPGVRKPGVYMEFNTTARKRALPNNEQPTVIIAQAIEADAARYKLLDVYDDGQAATLFGRGSLAHRMATAALTANPYMNLQFVLLDDEAWTYATANVLISPEQSAAKGGIAEVEIGADVVRVEVVKDASAADVATLWADAINARADLPAEASIVAGNLKLTAKTPGFIGAGIIINARCTAPGINISHVNMPLTTSSPRPSVEDIKFALTAIEAAGHKNIVVPYATPEILEAVRTHLDFVGNAVEQRGAVAFTAVTTVDEEEEV